MKVAVSVSGTNLDSQIDPRFGRCANFIIVDTDDLSFEAFGNENNALSGGAGIQSAQFVASKGAKAVITGHCGPNAVDTLSAAGIQLYVGESGTAMEAVERFNTGALRPATEPNVSDHHGMKGPNSTQTPQGGPTGANRGMGRGSGTGRGMGMGLGTGMGRGMGCGRGRNMGRVSGSEIPVTQSNPFQGDNDGEVNDLRDQVTTLNHQIQELQDRIQGLAKEKV